MQWDDIGFLLSKNRYNENSIVADIYTEQHGKCSGLIFGATSKKLKNYLQLGNKINVNYNYKNEGKIGYFKTEIIDANSPYYFDNKEKLLCLVSAMSLIKLITAEYQKNINIFKLIDDFFIILTKPDWVREFIFWELRLLELSGYSFDLSKFIQTEIKDNKKKYFVSSSTQKKYVPYFLIDKNEVNIDNKNLLDALILVGDFLKKNVLQPNNINYPVARLDFLNLFK